MTLPALARSARSWRTRPAALACALTFTLGACGRVGFVPVGDAATTSDIVPRDAADDLAPPPDAPLANDVPPGDAAVCPARESTDYCTHVPAIADTPVIDGEIDCGLVLHRITPQDWTGATAIPTTHWSEAAFGWRPDGLYVYVRVHDSATGRPAPEGGPVWCGEAVEVYFDNDGAYARPPGYDVPGTLQFVAASPAGGTTRASRGEEYSGGTLLGPWPTTSFATFPRTDGYVLEAFIRVADLGSPDAGRAMGNLAAGGHVGLDLAVDVPATTPLDASCGTRLGQYFLRSFPGQPPPCRGLPFCDVRAFCTAQLLAP